MVGRGKEKGTVVVGYNIKKQNFMPKPTKKRFNYKTVDWAEEYMTYISLLGYTIS